MPSRLARRSGAARLVRSHSRTVPSVMPAARYRASGLKLIFVAYPSAHSRGLPSGVGLAASVTSHSQIDLSLPLAAIVRPSGLNAALYTNPPRLLRRDVGASGTPWDRSHSVIDASSEDTASRVPG